MKQTVQGQSMGQSEEVICQVKHDLRAPLVNIKGFSEELREAFGNFITLVNDHEEDLPSEFHDGATKLLNEDLIPCLDFLEHAVVQLDQRVDTFAQKSDTDHELRRPNINKL